jgi:hypothetical protein
MTKGTASSAQVVSPLDRLLSQALLSIIKEKLGSKTCEKIESRLQQRHGLSLAESMKQFHTVDATLREFFGDGADALEADFLERIISFAKPQGSIVDSGNDRWIKVEHSSLIEIILSSYGDNEKRKILDAVIGQPSTVSKILDACMIPKSSGYRIINEMLDNGLLFEENVSKTSDGKRVSNYSALFQRVKIDIESKSNANLQVLVKESSILSSHILRILDRTCIQ